MVERAMLPIGIESFEEIRKENFYYIDKTGMIWELLRNWGKINLFTRPRRFDKSLNIDTLKYFFQYGCNPVLFEGLEITQDRELCEKFMGKYPVISITLKGVEFNNFETARAALCSVISNEALRFPFLGQSGVLSGQDRERYQYLVRMGQPGQESFVMTDEVLTDSLRTLSELLRRYYNQQVILLIDEYDVPLDKARQNGYYDQMLSLICRMFNQVLKGNNSIYFAVLTGCLRVSRESIFTGLNNMRIFSVEDVPFSKYFGFTDIEVRAVLGYYGLSSKYNTVKEWYNGYLFGNSNIYCPWDVMNYVALLLSDADMEPRPFWMNTSSNDIIRTLLEKATQTTKLELEKLAAGESIYKTINRELTYRDLYDNIDNLWSVLYTTGYLTVSEMPKGDTFCLQIPNREIRQIYVKQVMEWIREETTRDTSRPDGFCAALAAGNAQAVEDGFIEYLSRTISIRDTGAAMV